MGREYKFRAWNEVDKVMITNLNSPGLWRGILVPDADDILMQFTGLQDKGGVDVFEGDILEYTSDMTGITYTDAIKWGGAALKTGFQVDSPYINIYGGGIEVIGNIYENPELLGGESC